jgi:hypothetical protein
LPKEVLTQEDIQKLKKIVDDTSKEMEKDDFDFAAFSAGFTRGYYTPQMTNTNMQNVNLNPIVTTHANHLKALQSARSSEDLIISYCQNEYLTNTLFKRNFDYYANLLSYDLKIEPVVEKVSDFNTPAFKKDWKVVEDFFDKFDYRAEFQKALHNMLNSDVYACIFRTDLSDEKYTLQDFSYKYIRLTGKDSYGLLADIDLSFLLNRTYDIDLFPKWVTKKYNSVFKQNKYVPSADMNHRTGTFAYWVQTSRDELWIYKFTSDFVTEIPYFSPMMLDTDLTDFYRDLQVNQSLIGAKKLITSQWPLLEAKTAQSDRLAIKSTLMGEILGGIKAGLGEYFNIANLPSDKIEVHQMENTDKESYQMFLKTVSGLLGGANTLFSVVKQSSTESMISADIDAMLMESVYPQFENFLKYYVNKFTKKFKFNFKLSGTKSYLDKDRKYKAAFDAAKVGVVSENLIANVLGMNAIELERELDFTKSRGFMDKLLKMPNIFTQSGKDDETGRPRNSESEISESSDTTRSSGSNLERGGKI